MRFVQGEGFSKPAPITAPMVGIPVSIEQINSPENRLERLRQQELTKIGEDDVQRFARFIPVVGPAIDYSYDRISGTEFAGSLGIDAASTLALGGMQKAGAGSKAALQAQFQRNLYAKFNQAPYNPRTSQNLASRLLGTDEFTRTTVPGQSMPNVRLAGQCKERIVGTDPLTFEPIIQRVVFDQRGFPIFDPYIPAEVRITGNLSNMSSTAHMRLATQQLRKDILEGRVDSKLFNEVQLRKIMEGSSRIPGFTWHHHQEFGRVQLVPTDIHNWIKHVGGNELWGARK